VSAYFNSQALIIARESRGKSQTEVAQAAGVSQGAISKAETDVTVPSPEVVERIAAFLRYPVEFFSEPGQLRDGASICHYHRKRKTLPAKVLDRVNATMFVRNVNIRHMLNGLDVDSPRGFHTLEVDEFGCPAAVAAALRTAWRIPHGPIPNLTALIESAGGIVIFSPFGHRKLFGMSCWPTRMHPLFYMNSEIATADLRWTIAHELGHLTMHGTPSPNDIEKEADEFAAEFLTPAADIAPTLRSVTFEQLGPLKLHWRISMKALIHRAQDVAAISREEATRLYKRHSWHGYNAVEPFNVPAEIPTLLSQAAHIHLSEHGYTSAELRRAIRIVDDDDYAEITRLHPRRGRLSAVRS